MMELSGTQAAEVAGGLSFGALLGSMPTGGGLFSAYVSAISAAGATLSNYYGSDMTIQIIAAGNMTA